LADPEAYDQIVLTNPDFGKRLPDRCAMNEADRASCFGGTAQG
jgi:N-ethylmaleimide reductase